MKRHEGEELIKRYNEEAFEAVEFTAADPEGETQLSRLEGYAVIFERPTTIHDMLGEFTEVISREALANTDIKDVALYFNHDDGAIPLARSKNGKGTLNFAVDEKGLKFTADLDTENNAEAKALWSAVKRGDVTGMSFACRVAKNGDVWNGLGTAKVSRRINNISILHEISVVNYPAYKDTEVLARNENTSDVLASVTEEFNKKKLELEKEKTKVLKSAIL